MPSRSAAQRTSIFADDLGWSRIRSASYTVLTRHEVVAPGGAAYHDQLRPPRRTAARSAPSCDLVGDPTRRAKIDVNLKHTS